LQFAGLALIIGEPARFAKGHGLPGDGTMFRATVNFMIIPQKDGRILRLRLSEWTVKLLVFLGLGATVLSLGMLIDYAYIQSAFREQREMEKAIKLQQFTLQRLHNDLDTTRDLLAKYEEMDRKLRVISGLQDSGPNAPSQSASAGPGTISKLSLLARLENLAFDIKTREISFFQLEGFLQSQRDRLARTPSIAPAQGHYSSGFGRRLDPFTGKAKMHNGMDISAGPFTPIIAPGDGVVVAAYINAGYGRFLVIDHGYDIVTRYAHLSKFEVQVGQKVKRGELIARMGSTGRSTATHLHYEVLVRDQHVDPEQFVLE